MDLRYEDLTYLYGATVALELGHGQIDSGRITGLAGPAGAGKSTLLALIAGHLKPSDGRITYGYRDEDGQQRFTPKVPRDQIALVSLRSPLPHLSVEGAIAQALRARGASREERRARAETLMEALDLRSSARRRGWQLTNDEKLRVALARALAPAPDLLLLDEPPFEPSEETVALMEAFIRQERDERGLTVVVAGRCTTRLQRLCDRIIYLQEGHIASTSL
jgi:ABC-type multidrug transport system ATPase subunit